MSMWSGRLTALCCCAVALNCGASWRDEIRRHGYSPLMTPNDGLLEPGTIVIVFRENPLEYRILCKAKGWGVAEKVDEVDGFETLTAQHDLSAEMNVQLKKALEADASLAYSKKTLLEIAKVKLAEVAEADMRVEGAFATEQCRRTVEAAHRQKLRVSVVVGYFRSNLRFSDYLKKEVAVNAEVRKVVSTTLGVESLKTLSGQGSSLIWGIKYVNLPSRLGPRVTRPSDIPRCLEVDGNQCTACEAFGSFQGVSGGGTLPLPPPCQQMVHGTYDVELSYEITGVTGGASEVWQAFEITDNAGPRTPIDEREPINTKHVVVGSMDTDPDGRLSLARIRLTRCDANGPKSCNGGLSVTYRLRKTLPAPRCVAQKTDL